VKGRVYNASRWAWIREHGPIPKGLHVLHRCDNRACWNVEHLFLGTNAENVEYKSKKLRNGRAMTPNKVRLLLAESVLCKVTQRELAERHGVSQSTVCNIVNRKIWRHVS
jgi:DNA-binding XRE family transcriptional regulator